MITAQQEWAEQITRDCFLSAGDDTEAALVAAEMLAGILPLPKWDKVENISLAHDIYNRQAQGILNRSLQAVKGLSAAARRELAIVLKRARTGSAKPILDFIDKYRVQLAKILTQTQIASMLEGAREVADKMPTLTEFPGAIPPPPTLEPQKAVKLIEQLEKLTPEKQVEKIIELKPAEQVYVRQAMAARAAPPPVIPPITPHRTGGAEEPEGIHFPIIDEAVKNLAERNVMTRDRYDALESAARAKAFTVANVSADETLTKIRDSLAENVKEGADYETWRKKVMEDVEQGTFMSEAHQETVFRTNVQTAFSDGQESILQHPLVRSAFPYRARHAIHDERVRENHLALETLGIDGTNIYRADDPVWQLFRAPWDYNDRCSDIAMTVRHAAEKGIKEAQDWLESGVEPTDKAFVTMPDFQPPSGFQRSVSAMPLSIQLSMQSIATFSHDVSGEKRDNSGKWTNGDGNDASNHKQVVRKWIKKSASLPRKAVVYATNKAKKMYVKLEGKYGPRWAKAIITVGIVTFPTPFTTGAVLAMCGVAHLSNKLFAKGVVMSVDDQIDMEKAGRIGRKFIEALAKKLDGITLSLDAEGHEHKGKGRDGGQFTGKGGGSGVEQDDKTYEKAPAIRGTMAQAQRIGKGKEAKIVMADGSPVPEWIKPGMIAPTLKNVMVATDPKAEVLVIGTKPNGEIFTGYSDQFHMRNAALKFDRVQEMLQKHDKIFSQNQANRKDAALVDHADCTWLIDLQGTRPGGESDTKGLAKFFGRPMTKNMVGVDVPIKVQTPEGEKERIVSLAIKIDGQTIIMKDDGTREQIKSILKSGGNLHDTDYWMKSYGATTLEGRHIVQSNDGVRLQFVGKEGVWHNHLIRDKNLAVMLLSRKKKAGDKGKVFPETNSVKLNKYQEMLDGGKFTAKDFRTKRANLIALEEVGKINKPFQDEKSYKKAVMEVAEKVSHVLGNRPPQALESYINPTVFDRWKPKEMKSNVA